MNKKKDIQWIWNKTIKMWLKCRLYALELLSSVTSPINSNPGPATGSNAYSCHHTTPPCFTDDVVCFGSWAVPSLLHTLFLHVNLVQVDLKFSRLIWPCLHLVIYPLYLLCWNLLLIVDFDSDTLTSWIVFLSWLDVVKGFFFTMEKILRSSATLSSVDLQAFLCCWTQRCVLFYSQNVRNCWFGHS